MAKKVVKANIDESIEAAKVEVSEEVVVSLDITPERLEYLKNKGTMDEIRPVVEEIVKAQNAWYLDKDYTNANSWDETLTILVNRYTANAREKAFTECKKSEDGPMLAAIKMLTFRSIRVKDTIDRENDIRKREVDDRDVDIDLLALDKDVKGGIGADKQWKYKLQKLNYLMAIKVGQAIGDEKWKPENLHLIRDSFLMDDIAKSFEFGNANPVSNTQMLKTLNAIVNAMIGDEYKTNSHAVAWLSEAYSKRDKRALTVQLPNHKSFTLLMRDICHEAVMKCGFSAISKCVK